MKLYVNNREVEVEPSGFEIDRLSDRLMVKSPEGSFSAVAVRAGDAVLISYRGNQYKVERSRPRGGGSGVLSSGDLLAPMPGLIVDVLVSLGSAVQKGDRLLVLEAMKTQQSFTAPFDGVVIKLSVSKGDQVAEGAPLVTVEPNSTG